MKVKELIEELKLCDLEKEVVVAYSKDDIFTESSYDVIEVIEIDSHKNTDITAVYITTEE